MNINEALYIYPENDKTLLVDDSRSELIDQPISNLVDRLPDSFFKVGTSCFIAAGLIGKVRKVRPSQIEISLIKLSKKILRKVVLTQV